MGSWPARTLLPLLCALEDGEEAARRGARAEGDDDESDQDEEALTGLGAGFKLPPGAAEKLLGGKYRTLAKEFRECIQKAWASVMPKEAPLTTSFAHDESDGQLPAVVLDLGSPTSSDTTRGLAAGPSNRRPVLERLGSTPEQRRSRYTANLEKTASSSAATTQDTWKGRIDLMERSMISLGSTLEQWNFTQSCQSSDSKALTSTGFYLTRSSCAENPAFRATTGEVRRLMC